MFASGALVTCAGRQGNAWEDAAQDTSSRSYFQADTGLVRVVHRHPVSPSAREHWGR